MGLLTAPLRSAVASPTYQPLSVVACSSIVPKPCSTARKTHEVHCQRRAIKYDFECPEDQLITLLKSLKTVVDDKAQYPGWSQRDDIKAGLMVDLIMLLAEHGYPPVDRDEVYKEILSRLKTLRNTKAHDV